MVRFVAEHSRGAKLRGKEGSDDDGAIRFAWSRTSVVLAAVVFAGLGLGRALGIVVDGSPGAEVIKGMTIELVFACVALFAFFKYRNAEHRP